MPDDGDPDDTVRQPATLRGAVKTTVAVHPGERDDVGSAATVAQPSMPPGPAAAAGMSAGGSTRPLGPRAAASGVSPLGDHERYTLGSLIGQGGMGEVVLAYDEHIGREVAVKRIRADAPSAEELSRFLREARVQGRLEHPAIVPVHDLVFDRGGKPYFVMKRLSGTTMAELLATVRGDGDDAAAVRRRLLRAFVDVCLAVEFAHRAGIVHRDLKPANIMLGDYGEVYVLDWGVARAVTDPDDRTDRASAEPAASSSPTSLGEGLQLDSGETRVGTVLGTPAYMAPEQLAGERAGPAADTYALGCILYEIASGRILHGSRRSLASLVAPVDARPSAVRRESPPELDVLCERATQLEPSARFAAARTLGDGVQAFLDGDRDLAVRRELAQHHLAAARAALAAGDGEDRRREAMREAGRALALDPTAAEAAALVTRLVLEPPTETPAEVERHLIALDTATARTQGRLAALSMIGYLAFVPLLLWAGVHDGVFIATFAGLAVVCGVQVWALTRSDHISRRGIYVSAVINAVLIALICRMVGPFIIAPTLVTTTLMVYAAHPSFGSIRIVSAILVASVVVPWALEGAGVLASTYRFVGDELVLSSSIVNFAAVPTSISFAVLLVVLVTVVAVFTRGMALQQQRATRTLEVQAWHLRQIVPTQPTA